jgi:hypothetical protein
METVSQLLAERDAAEAEESDTFTKLRDTATTIADELVRARMERDAYQFMLRTVIANIVAQDVGEDEAAEVANGGPLPDGYDFAPCIYDAMKVLGQWQGRNLQ